MASVYGVVLVVHIASIAVAFGAAATSPLVLRVVRRESPASAAPLIGAQRRLGTAVVTPAATLTLLTGVLLATLGGYWGELWVSLPLSLLVFVLSLHGAFITPTERRLEALAAHTTDPSPDVEAGPFVLYDAVARRLAVARHLSSLAILAALTLMVLKP